MFTHVNMNIFKTFVAIVPCQNLDVIVVKLDNVEVFDWGFVPYHFIDMRKTTFH